METMVSLYGVVKEIAVGYEDLRIALIDKQGKLEDMEGKRDFWRGTALIAGGAELLTAIILLLVVLL